MRERTDLSGASGDLEEFLPKTDRGMNLPMRVLVVHNHYQQAGGEDVVVRSETELLRNHGVDVELWEESNESIVSRWDACVTALQCVHSFAAAREMRRRIERFQPDLVHVHNFFPRLSPAIHRACYRARVPLVQSLHNFRLVCSGAMLQRDGKPCEECVGKAVAWPALRHRCYRGSTAGSAAVALSFRGATRTWHRDVSRYIALSEFARNKFIGCGFAEDRIAVKPNFVDPDPGMGAGDGDYALFAGRLSSEKGIETLLEAFRGMSRRPHLKIFGDGPLRHDVAQAAATMREIEWCGARPHQEVTRAMRTARVLIVPSAWYEGFPMVIAEAFAAGLPVIASRLGAMEEVVENGATGHLFVAGQPEDLALRVEWAFTQKVRMQAMRLKARFEYLSKYTARMNYALLADIYRAAIGTCDKRQAGALLPS